MWERSLLASVSCGYRHALKVYLIKCTSFNGIPLQKKAITWPRGTVAAASRSARIVRGFANHWS